MHNPVWVLPFGLIYNTTTVLSTSREGAQQPRTCTSRTFVRRKTQLVSRGAISCVVSVLFAARYIPAAGFSLGIVREKKKHIW
jgi:hypothetical protein